MTKNNPKKDSKLVLESLDQKEIERVLLIVAERVLADAARVEAKRKARKARRKPKP